MKLRTVAAMLMLFCCFNASNLLADTSWESVGPFGGLINNIVVDPTDSQVAYINTYSGDCYKTGNGGSSWDKDVYFSGLANKVNKLLFDPNTNQLIYAQTSDGVFKTTNGGTSWLKLNSGDPYLPLNLSFTLAPKDSQTIYWISKDGLYRSTDGGSVWSPAYSGLPSPYYSSIAVSPADSNTVYLGVRDFGVYKTTNGGASWVNINNGLPQAEYQYGTYLAVDVKNSLTIFAGTNAHIYKSTNGGSSWSSITGFGGYPKTVPRNYQTLYVVTANQSGVYKSTDSGTIWSTANINLGNLDIRSFAIATDNTNVLYTGTYNDIYKSVDGGAAWKIVNTGIESSTINALAIYPGNSRTVYAGTNMGEIFITENGGSSWTSLSSGTSLRNIDSVKAVVIDPKNSQNIYLATSKGVLKTANGGTSWSDMNTGLTWLESGCIAIDPVNTLNIYSGGINSIFKSTNGGGNWVNIGAGLGIRQVNSLVIDPSSSQTIYAATTYPTGTFPFETIHPRILKSTNSGTTWSATAGVPGSIINVLLLDPNNTQTIYAGTAGGVYKSSNGGTSWGAVNTGLTNTSILSLAFDPVTSQTIYAATAGGVFKSTNGGARWIPFNAGLTNMPVNSIAADLSDSQTVYAGTAGGIFKTVFQGAPIINAPATANFNIGATGSFKVSASGWPAPVLSVSSPLPNGLSFNAATGILSGTPLLGSAGVSPLLFTAGNGNPPDATRAVTVTVLPSSTLNIAIATPANNNFSLVSLASFTGTAFGTGLSSVEIQITDGTYYLQSNNTFTTTPAWLNVTGTTTWNRSAASIPWVEGINYTMNARANSSSGPQKVSTAAFLFQPSTSKQGTILSFTLTPNSIKTGDSITLSGSLVKTDTAVIAGRSITVIITPPSTATVPNPAPVINTYTTDVNGAFSSDAISQFVTPGVYMVQARFKGDATYQASCQTLSLPVVAHSGYALIVVGKASDNNLLDEHTRTATFAYNAMISKRGFLSSNIFPLVSSTGAAVTRQQITDALAQIKTRYIAAPAPVYLILIDHGSTTGFKLGADTLTPADFGTMLDSFEIGIDTTTLANWKRFLIVGTCYSGIFQGLSRPGRVILTSSSASEESLVGATAYADTISSLSGGDYFIDTLFSFLGRGESFSKSFAHATNAVNLRDPRAVTLGEHAGVVDTLAQHPLLSDNGDMIPTYNLARGNDGSVAANLYLGEGIRVPANGNPADIIEVLPTTTLSQTVSSAPLWLKVNDNARVYRAWVEIRTPDTTVATTGTGQVTPNFDSMMLIYDGEKWIGDYSAFTSSGRYDIYYYTRDIQTGDVSPMGHTVIYKSKAGNVAPDSFELISPANGTEENTQPVFMWQPSADSDPVTYTLLISTSSNFSTGNLLPIEQISNTSYPVGPDLLQNLTTYYWKVRATDEFGATTDSPTWSFMTVDTSAITVTIYGIVRDAASMQPINAASVTIDTAPLPQVTVSQFGSYTLKLQNVGDYNLAVQHADYQDVTTLVTIPSQGMITNWQQDLYLTATPLEQLSVTLTGGGGGSVNSLPVGIACTSGSCSAPFPLGSPVKLMSTANVLSTFSGWSGACTGTGNCDLTMDSAKAVTATFTGASKIMVGSKAFFTLQTAYDDTATTNGSVIKLLEGILVNTFIAERSIAVNLEGGYNAAYNAINSETTIQGPVIVRAGMVRMKGINVK